MGWEGREEGKRREEGRGEGGDGGGREREGREGEGKGEGPETDLPRGPRWLSAGLQTSASVLSVSMLKITPVI